MSEKPRRRWFRFHLLTSIVMMLAAGSMVWLNFRERVGSRQIGESLCYGWPFDAAERVWIGWSEKTVVDWRYGYLLADAVVTLLMIAVIGFFSEWLIRRREARKT